MTDQDGPSMAAEDSWASELPPFAELVAGLAGLDEDEDDNSSPSMELEELVLTLSIEFEVRDPDGDGPRVTGSTPTQWTETTVMPVFHRLSMRLTRDVDA